MAEWVGSRRGARLEILDGIEDLAATLDGTASDDGPPAPPAPGAVASPQDPGMVPDRSTVPGHHGVTVPDRVDPVRRPLTEYGTAQRIVDIYAAVPGKEMDPTRYKGPPVSNEEARKVEPNLGTPVRPVAGYALGRNAAPALAAPAATEALAAGEETRALAAEVSAEVTAASTPTAALPAAAPAPAAPAPAPAASAPAGIAGDAAVARATAGGEAHDRAEAARRGGALAAAWGHDCPGDHPVKGNAQSGIFHEPTSPSYRVTIPEFCFRTAADAEAAGFRAPKNDPRHH